MRTSLAALSKLISEHSDDGVEFGDSHCELSPTERRIDETEAALGCKLPPSYLWFLKKYGGGEVYGEEIYSIYPVLSKQSVGDVVYQTRWSRSRNFVNETAIVVCTNDFGEIFYMDTSSSDEAGEYPIFVKAGREERKYADTFADFLFKRISDPEG